MGPSLSTNNSVGILISTTADTAGSEQIDAALQSNDATLKGVGETAAAVGDEVTASLDKVDESAAVTKESFLSLGATADEYAANMREIATATDGAVGDITMLGDATKAERDIVISSNDEMIASYRELGAAADESAGSSALSDMASGAGNKAAGISGIAGALSSPYVLAGAAVTGALYEAIKAGANFQTQMTRVYNTAGATANYKALSDAILNISGATGVAIGNTTSGLMGAEYHISSVGYSALNGTKLLQAAAQGAVEEGADVTTVANTLATVMHDYGASANQSNAYMNMLITTTAHGNTTLQQLTESLATVLPVAQKSGLSFAQIGGALATMTATTGSANEATFQLRSLILGIINPTATAAKTMQNYGINITELQKNLGKEGLSGTIEQVINDMAKYTKGGVVIQQTLQNATVAQQKLTQEIAAAPAPVAQLARELQNGTISFKEYRTASQSLPEGMTNFAKQIETTYNQANSFNNLLTNGSSPAVQTFTAALKTLFPNINATQAVLELTGNNEKIVEANTKAVSNAAKTAGSNIEGWKDQQATLNTQFDMAKTKVGALAINIGTQLLPVATELLKIFNDMIGALSSVVNGIEKLDHAASSSKIGKLLGSAAKANPLAAANVLSNLFSVPGFASGTNYAPGGPTIVGENGPEAVILPTGSQVKTPAQTQSMMAGGGSSSGVTLYQTNYNYSQFDLETANRQLGFMLASAGAA